MSAAEQLIDLGAHPAGAAASQLVELAGQAGYSVVATAPGTYLLARTRRRMVVSKRTESVTVSVFEDRTGTKLRVVGPLDPTLIAHLRAAVSPAPPAVPSASPTHDPPPAASSPAGGVAAPPPVVDVPPPAAPAPPPHSTWAPQSDVRPASPTPPAPTPHAVSDLDAHTIARPAAPSSSGLAIELPDGRRIPLTTAIVIGRNPDVGRGPDGAVAVAVADPTMSKTHLVVEISNGAVCVTDLHSTNGTTLDTATSSARVVAGTRSPVPADAIVRAGELVIRVVGDS